MNIASNIRKIISTSQLSYTKKWGGASRHSFFPKDVSSQGSSEDCWRISHHTKLSEASRETLVLEALFYEIWRKPRTKWSFWKLFLWELSEASRETLVLEARSVKFGGSIAQNARFGSLFCEIWRKHRAKRSFWKLFLWKLSEASRETLVLEACSVKFGGSLARNDHFGSFFCEKLRKPRTKCSFWKLL